MPRTVPETMQAVLVAVALVVVPASGQGNSICLSVGDGSGYNGSRIAVPANCKLNGASGEDCFNAGGVPVDDRCLGLSQADCDSDAGFDYDPELSCDSANQFVANSFNCSDFGLQILIHKVAYTCCGGENNAVNICPDVPPAYQGICATPNGFDPERELFYMCVGADSSACVQAGGTYDASKYECNGFPDANDAAAACSAISGFSYVSSTSCGEFSTAVSLNMSGMNCNQPFFSSTLAHAQGTCCGNNSNFRDMCPGSASPSELFCTANASFNGAAGIFPDCFADSGDTNETICREAGGDITFNDNQLKCENVDGATCNSMSGFSYRNSTTCQQLAQYIASTGQAESFLNCSNPQTPSILSQVQTACCGGEEFHRDVCHLQNRTTPGQLLCNREDAFAVNANVDVFFKCYGSNETACNAGGGSFDQEDGGVCDDIDSESACSRIGFLWSSSATCSGVESDLMNNPEEFQNMLSCANRTVENVYQSIYIQTACCGLNNSREVCPGQAPLYTAFGCNSYSNFNATGEGDNIKLGDCSGQSEEACTEAGGRFNQSNRVCTGLQSIEQCNSIGFVFQAFTCQDAAMYWLNFPELVPPYLTCDNASGQALLQSMQRTCCGSDGFAVPFCETLSPTPAPTEAAPTPAPTEAAPTLDPLLESTTEVPSDTTRQQSSTVTFKFRRSFSSLSESSKETLRSQIRSAVYNISSDYSEVDQQNIQIELSGSSSEIVVLVRFPPAVSQSEASQVAAEINSNPVSVSDPDDPNASLQSFDASYAGPDDSDTGGNVAYRSAARTWLLSVCAVAAVMIAAF